MDASNFTPQINKSNFLYFIFKKVQAGGYNERQCQVYGRR
jgi:hypothetical protein